MRYKTNCNLYWIIVACICVYVADEQMIPKDSKWCNLNENINATIHPWRFPWAALTARYKSCNLRAVLWKPCFFSFLHYFLFPKIVMSFPCYISGWQLTLNYLKKLMSFYRLVDRILGVKEKIKSEITFSIFDSVAKSATSRQTSTST